MRSYCVSVNEVAASLAIFGPFFDLLCEHLDPAFRRVHANSHLDVNNRNYRADFAVGYINVAGFVPHNAVGRLVWIPSVGYHPRVRGLDYLVTDAKR